MGQREGLSSWHCSAQKVWRILYVCVWCVCACVRVCVEGGLWRETESVTLSILCLRAVSCMLPSTELLQCVTHCYSCQVWENNKKHRFSTLKRKIEWSNAQTWRQHFFTGWVVGKCFMNRIYHMHTWKPLAQTSWISSLELSSCSSARGEMQCKSRSNWKHALMMAMARSLGKILTVHAVVYAFIVVESVEAVYSKFPSFGDFWGLFLSLKIHVLGI